MACALEKLVKRLETEESTDDILTLMRFLTLDSFGQSAFHTNFGCCESLQPPRIMESFDFLAHEMMRRMGTDILNPASHIYTLPTQANKRHAQEVSFVRSFIGELVQERCRLMKDEKEVVPSDLLTSLIQNAREQQDDNQLSEETLADVLLSLLIAGFETTSVTLTYVFYMLSQHPGVEEKCLEAIAAASRADDCQYVTAVIKETLRLYPPAISTTRSLEREVTIGDDIVVPEGTYLYIPIWCIQRDPRNFPDPLEFRPERWTENRNGKWCEREYKDGRDDAGNPNAFVAFSAGARSCAGQRFAMQEMTIVLSTILPKYRFVPPADYVLTPHRDGLVQSPKGGIPMKIVERK